MSPSKDEEQKPQLSDKEADKLYKMVEDHDGKKKPQSTTKRVAGRRRPRPGSSGSSRS